MLIVIFGVKDMPKNNVKHKKYKLNNKDLNLVPLLIFYFFFLLFLVSDSYYLLHAKALGFPLSFIPIFIIILTLTQTALSYIIGKSIDRFNPQVILSCAFLAGILATIFLKVNLYFAFVFLGIFTVSSLNALRAYISKNADHKASVFGLLYGGSAIFSATGIFLIGFIWGNYGFNMIFLISLIGLMSVFALYNLLYLLGGFAT